MQPRDSGADSFAKEDSLLTSTANCGRRQEESKTQSRERAYGQNYGMGNSQHIFFWVSFISRVVAV